MKNSSTRRTPFTNLLNAYLYLYSLSVRLSNSMVVCSVRTFWFLLPFPSGIYLYKLININKYDNLNTTTYTPILVFMTIVAVIHIKRLQNM